MKIAFVGGFAFRPKGTIRARAHPLAVELVKLGHEVTIFLTPYDNPGDSCRDWTQEGVQIKNLKVSSSPLSYPGLLISLLRALDHYHPDVVHIFKPKGFAGAAGSYLLMKGSHTIVLDCDDLEGWGGWNEVKSYPWIVKEYIHRQERWMMKSTPVVTVASRALLDRVSEVRGASSGIYYVPNCGVSAGNTRIQDTIRRCSPTEARRALGLPDGLLVLYTGHFEAAENPMFLCRVAEAVTRRDEITFVFVGSGPELPKLKHFFSHESGLKAQFLSELPLEQYLLAIWASDVTAFPFPDNPVHRSKCSARIIDYMSMGKPVITSRVGQNEEYIVDGVSGMLITPNDARLFAEKLDILLQNPKLRASLGEMAEMRIREKFRWNGEAVNHCLAAYEELFVRQSTLVGNRVFAFLRKRI